MEPKEHCGPAEPCSRSVAADRSRTAPTAAGCDRGYRAFDGVTRLRPGTEGGEAWCIEHHASPPASGSLTISRLPRPLAAEVDDREAVVPVGEVGGLIRPRVLRP